MIISFPGTDSIKRNGTSPQKGNDGNRPLYIRRRHAGDRLELSAEAKMKFRQEKLVSLERERLMKEASSLMEILDRELSFREADLRKISRLPEIVRAKERLDSSFYDLYEDEILKKVIDDSF